MDYGKVIYDDFDFDDDSQGIVRIGLTKDQFNQLLLKSSQFEVVRYGDVFYKFYKFDESVPDITDAILFFRVNFEANELRFCAEMSLNKPQPPMYYSDNHNHSRIVEPNILRRKFDLDAAMPDILPSDHEYCKWFTEKNSLFRLYLPASDIKKDLTINVKRHLCLGFNRPLLLDEMTAVRAGSTLTFYEAVFFGDSLTEMEAGIFEVREIIGEISGTEQSRYEIASTLK